MPNRADSHDLDKLKRWQKDLETTPADAPAVYAIFLVSERDTVAHETFRIFRDSFQERNAGFANLVIFGQHGVSETARRLRAELGLPDDRLPILVVLGGDGETEPQIVPLPAGATNEAEPEGENGWQSALAGAEGIMDAGISDGGPIELKRELRTYVTTLCSSVVESLEKC